MVCKRCGLDAEFYDSNKSYCKECVKAAARKRARTNPAVQAYDVARAKTPERRAKSIAFAKAWRSKYPDRYKAHNAVNNAVRDGKLQKKPCEVCGAEYAHAHHDDYARPLDVRWLCPKHHFRGHSDYGEVG